MSSSTTLFSALISSIFILIFVSNFIISSAKNGAPNPLIEKVCSDPRLASKTKLCIQVLRSQPMIISATNLHDISIAIMRSGISNATITREYVQKSLRNPNLSPNSKGALQECKQSFDLVIISYNSASSEVNDKEYDTATYDLLVGSTDDIQQCVDNVASGRINDSTISNGINVVPIYGFSAYHAIDHL